MADIAHFAIMVLAALAIETHGLEMSSGDDGAASMGWLSRLDHRRQPELGAKEYGRKLGVSRCTGGACRTERAQCSFAAGEGVDLALLFYGKVGSLAGKVNSSMHKPNCDTFRLSLRSMFRNVLNFLENSADTECTRPANNISVLGHSWGSDTHEDAGRACIESVLRDAQQRHNVSTIRIVYTTPPPPARVPAELLDELSTREADRFQHDYMANNIIPSWQSRLHAIDAARREERSRGRPFSYLLLTRFDLAQCELALPREWALNETHRLLIPTWASFDPFKSGKVQYGDRLLPAAYAADYIFGGSSTVLHRLASVHVANLEAWKYQHQSPPATNPHDTLALTIRRLFAPTDVRFSRAFKLGSATNLVRHFVAPRGEKPPAWFERCFGCRSVEECRRQGV